MQDVVKCLFLSQEHTFCYNKNSYNYGKLHLQIKKLYVDSPAYMEAPALRKHGTKVDRLI